MRLVVMRVVAGLLASGALPLVTLAQSGDFEDVRLAERTVQNTLEQQDTGQAGQWRNPATGVAGTITVVRSGLAPTGQKCREYTHKWQMASTETTYRGIRCREPTGLWKLVEPETVVTQVARAAPPPDAPAAAPAPPVGATASDIRRLQAALKDLLYLGGPVDGIMDARTRQARDRFAEDEQLMLSPEPDVAALADHAAGVLRRQKPGGACPIPAPRGKLIACGVL